MLPIISVFADAALGARIDRAEGRLCARLALATSPSPEAGGPFVVPISGGLAVFASRGSPMNKVIGAGFDGPLDLEVLANIEGRWTVRHEPVRVELSILADPGAVAALAARGYRWHGFENVLGAPLGEASTPGSNRGLTTEIIGREGFREWFNVAVESFANMDGSGSTADPEMSREELERVLGEVTGPDVFDGMTRYLARVDGEPAGEAALNVDDRLAHLAGSGTVPRFRGRGVQKALISRRLADARQQGCDLAVVVTAPGSRSQRNVMRRGFQLLYTRAILTKLADTRS